MPMSSKAFGLSRPFGLGFSNFLKEGKIDIGIEPRDVDAGGGWGGAAVAGGGCEGLKTACKRRPRAYASATAGSYL